MCRIWYPYLAPFSRYWTKLRRWYFRFLDFWSIRYKRNCRNSKTSDDIDRKLGSVTKLHKRNQTTSKKVDNDVMSKKNCDFIVIYGQFGAVQKLDSGRIACKSMFSLIVTFCLIKAENRTKELLTLLLH